MGASATTLVSFLKSAKTITGHGFVEQMLRDSDVKIAARESGIDVDSLLLAMSGLESDDDFITQCFESFRRTEERIRGEVGARMQEVGAGAFPEWKIGDRCTPLGFAMLQGLIHPDLIRQVELHGKAVSLEPFLGKHANSLRGALLYAMDLVTPYAAVKHIQGLDTFVQKLRSTS